MSNYTLRELNIDLSADEEAIVLAFPPTEKEQWSQSRYEEIKQRIKKELIVGQFDRCAYCRKIIEADGKYEPLEHIVAKSIKPTWMFNPKNLIVTCDSCNNLKGDVQTLDVAFRESEDLPTVSEAFIIFNPHVDIWDKHLRYEDEIFLVAVPKSKGADTIRICKLYRYNVIINRAKELKLLQKTPAKRILQRLRTIENDSEESNHIQNALMDAMDHYLDRVKENDDFL